MADKRGDGPCSADNQAKRESRRDQRRPRQIELTERELDERQPVDQHREPLSLRVEARRVAEAKLRRRSAADRS